MKLIKNEAALLLGAVGAAGTAMVQALNNNLGWHTLLLVGIWAAVSFLIRSNVLSASTGESLTQRISQLLVENSSMRAITRAASTSPSTQSQPPTPSPGPSPAAS